MRCCWALSQFFIYASRNHERMTVFFYLGVVKTFLSNSFSALLGNIKLGASFTGNAMIYTLNNRLWLLL